MSCKGRHEELALLVGEDLGAEQAGRLRAHLQACASCREALSELEASQAWWTEVATEIPEEMVLRGQTAIMERIRGEQAAEVRSLQQRIRSPSLRAKVWLPLAATLMVALTAWYLRATWWSTTPPFQVTQQSASPERRPGNTVADTRPSTDSAVPDKVDDPVPESAGTPSPRTPDSAQSASPVRALPQRTLPQRALPQRDQNPPDSPAGVAPQGSDAGSQARSGVESEPSRDMRPTHVASTSGPDTGSGGAALTPDAAIGRADEALIERSQHTNDNPIDGAATVLVKLLSDDPELVIYWLVDTQEASHDV